MVTKSKPRLVAMSVATVLCGAHSSLAEKPDLVWIMAEDISTSSRATVSRE